MNRARTTGPGAGVYKYDILTALTLWGLRVGPSEQATALRLVAMITARYNWQRDEISIGQKDLARLWGVTERTVKREIKRLLTVQLLELVRPGVRGRVACYRLVPETVARLSRDHWDAVGPDFSERLSAREGRAVVQEGPSVLRVDFAKLKTPLDATATDPWSRVQARLAEAAPDAHASWFSRLELRGVTDDRVELAASSPFVMRYINTHFGDLLRAAVAEGFGADKRLDLQLT